MLKVQVVEEGSSAQPCNNAAVADWLCCMFAGNPAPLSLSPSLNCTPPGWPCTSFDSALTVSPSHVLAFGSSSRSSVLAQHMIRIMIIFRVCWVLTGLASVGYGCAGQGRQDDRKLNCLGLQPCVAADLKGLEVLGLVGSAGVCIKVSRERRLAIPHVLPAPIDIPEAVSNAFTIQVSIPAWEPGTHSMLATHAKLFLTLLFLQKQSNFRALVRQKQVCSPRHAHIIAIYGEIINNRGSCTSHAV